MYPSQLPRSTPEAQGMSSSKIIAFLDALNEHHIELHSLMILKNKHVVCEGWWAPYQKDIPHMLFSLSKSFTSTAIGFAVNEGLLSVEDDVVNFFPDYRSIPDCFRKLKIKHLLCMGTGHEKDFTPDAIAHPDGDFVKCFFEHPLTYEPGTHFVYNNMATYMLSVILTRVSGQTVRDYLNQRLFAPLGIDEPYWETCPKGYNFGGWGLNLKTEDILKFGLLYLQKGIFEGKQILPSSWIEEATRAQIKNGDDPNSDWAQGYGYQFWRCRHNAYRGDGAFGQYCIVFPEQNAVIAITSAVHDMQTVLN
ncbi:MAG: beta-lactamase family protein, partial [Clostridia bacterium]|nr:beta-lactamase family protein [Clostridia bacterium]